MYKRALLLTAATMALLSAPAFAADNNSDITTKVTTNLKTSTANAGAASNILIETNGSVVVTSTTPAIEIDSSNVVTNKGLISNKDTTSAIGVQLDTGNTGALDSQGTIDLTGSGNNKIGIEILAPTGASSTTFTGTTALPSPVAAVTVPTAIYLESGSTLTVAGDGSTGILLNPLATVQGNITIGGSITMSPTSTTSTSGGGVTAVNLEGTMNGDFSILASGFVSSVGNNAQGVIVSGPLNGSFSNLGQIEALGSFTPSASQTNPEAGSAVAISSSITGGFYNGGADNANSGRATIAETGQAPAINIQVSSAATADLHLGVITDPALTQSDTFLGPNGLGTTGPLGPNGFSFINRGNINAASLSPNIITSALTLQGSNGFALDLDGDGLFNAGSITSSATTTSSASGVVASTGIFIGTNVHINKIVNSDEQVHGNATSSLISASVAGATPAIATAIDIRQGGFLQEIDNAGTISASATTTDVTISNLAAFAIRDETVDGTLTTINNSGIISALITPLNNGQQLGAAIDLVDSIQNVTLNNSGTVAGAIVFGTGNDTITDSGGSPNAPATITGNLDFGGGNDSLSLGLTGTPSHPGNFTGFIQEASGGEVEVKISPGSDLQLLNDGTDSNLGIDLTNNLPVSSLTVENGGTLGLTLAQVFNVNAPGSSVVVPVIQSSGQITIGASAAMNVRFGSFITATNVTDSSQFVLLDAPAGMLNIGNVGTINSDIAGSNIPFLFTGSVCVFNVPGAPPANDCTGPEPINSTDSELILNLKPKTAADLQLSGYAAKMFPIANVALANDNLLGGAVIQAGISSTLTPAQGNALYQKIYSAFAPDVTGSQRALAVALTDQATGAVGARQRALRMYAGQDGDATMWGQEFTERLNVGSQVEAAGYNDSGFGFALGIDGGSPAAGRYGAAFTFYSGDTSEKQPRESKTTSEWYMLTGYSDWRGKGLFLDSQLSVAYGSIDGRRDFDFTEANVRRVAEGKRSAALIAGGLTAGVALTAGGTVIMPQISIDGMSMREEGYTETNGGATTSSAVDGFDLQVRQEYNSSLRGFLGMDMRQDLNFGEFFLQPEVRAGYRYDFIDGAQKLKAQFVCSTVAGGCPATEFSITGPDPAKGNAVLGGSIAATTGAWSIGLNYDYIRGLGNGGGRDNVSQSGTITLVGRI